MKSYSILASNRIEVIANNAQEAAAKARELIPDKNFHLRVTEVIDVPVTYIQNNKSIVKCEFDKDKFLSDLSKIDYNGSLVPEIDVSSTKELKYFVTDPVMRIIVVGDIVYDLNNMVVTLIICNIINDHSEAYNKFYKNDYIAKFITDCQEELENSLKGNHERYQLIIENIFIKWQYDYLGIKE